MSDVRHTTNRTLNLIFIFLEVVPIMADSPRPRTLRAAYLALYTLGGCCTAVCVALLAWVAFCIAMEKEPLAAVAFLPHVPAAVVLLFILAIMVLGVVCWQWGARFHQRYEEYVLKQR